MKQIIVAQPNLKCCGNCNYFRNGYGGVNKCGYPGTSWFESAMYVRKTDVCNLFEE